MVAPMSHPGYIPAMGAHMGGGGPRPPLIRPPNMPNEPEGPPAKKAKTEDSLIPETEFLKRHNVSVIVQHLSVVESRDR